MFDSLIALLNSKYNRWSFTGSIVDWHHFDGQVMLKDIDVITSDYGELDFHESMRAPRDQFRWRGKIVEVFRGVPSDGLFETPEERFSKLKLVAEMFPYRADKCRRVIERYRGGTGAVVGASGKPRRNHIAEEREMVASCPNRGEQLRTITCNICGNRGKQIEVYACGVHGQCTHRAAQHGQESQDPPIAICLGCPSGPWAA